MINYRTTPQTKNQKAQQYAIAICRVSDEQQKQKNISIPAQRFRIEKWALENNVIVLKWVTFDRKRQKNRHLVNQWRLKIK